MANIKYSGKIDGTSLPRIQKFRIPRASEVAEGTPVAIASDGSPSTTFNSSTKGLFGVVARKYKNTADEFHPEYGKGYVAVNVSPDSVYELSLTKTVIANENKSDGSMTFKSTEYNAVADSFASVKLLLLKHGANPSSDAIGIGTLLQASGSDVTDGKLELYFEEKPVITAGDEFLVIPNAGFDNLTVSGSDVVFGKASSDKSYFTVADSDAEKRVAYIKPKNYLA